MRYSEVLVHIAAQSIPSGDAIREAFRRDLAIDPPAKDPTLLAFEHHNKEFVRPHEEAVVRAEWATVRSNYSSETASMLDALVELGPNDFGNGSLVFFAGEPGTGKTSALRSLMTMWDSWATFAVVSDPQEYFTSAQYRDGILHGSFSKTRVVILEDSDGVIKAESNRTEDMTGFLNSVDGLVASSYPSVHIFTANLKLTEIEPALVRPGRARAVVDFKRFSAEETKERCGHFAAMTLAEIAQARNLAPMIGAEPPRRPMGFQYL
jgi:SpoVK/Ycf46/Vps4 family AAA+-type ATPase